MYSTVPKPGTKRIHRVQCKRPNMETELKEDLAKAFEDNFDIGNAHTKMHTPQRLKSCTSSCSFTCELILFYKISLVVSVVTAFQNFDLVDY